MLIHTSSRRIQITAILALLCSACTGGDNTQGDSLQKNARPFQFSYEEVLETLIVKADPSTGDRWSARITRSDSDPMDWRIQSDSEGGALIDRRADGALIRHLLDTLRTLQVVDGGIAGPPESLGLAPPRFAITWKTKPAQANAANPSFELRIGAPTQDSGVSYAWTPGHPTFSAVGAALKILEHFNSFDALRLKTWVGITTDEVDEIELFKGSRSIYYAQREGSDWTRRDHRPIGLDHTNWLEKVTHSRVLRFIDDPTIAAQLRAQAEKTPVGKAALTDRHGTAVKLTIGWAKLGSQRSLIGVSSARDGVFEIYPEAASLLNVPRK